MKPAKSVAKLEDNRMSIRTLIGAAAALLASAAIYALGLNLHAAQDELLRRQSIQIADESRAYCQKWGFPAGTEQHRGCVVDLGDIRRHEARRAQDDALGYPE